MAKNRIICTKNDVDYLYIYDLLEVEELFDGLHPNNVGHQKICDKVKTKIIPLKPYIGGVLIPNLAKKFVIAPFLPSNIIHEYAPINGGDIRDIIIIILIIRLK